MAAAPMSAPRVIDHCEPMTDPPKVNQKVFDDGVDRGRYRE